MMNILQQQCYLTALGHYKLKRKDGSPAIDGIPGPATTEALVSFQEAYGMPSDGTFGPQTEKKLREVIGGDLKPTVPQPKPEPEKPSNGFSQYFRKQEFACKCGRCGGFPTQPSLQLVQLLDQIREHFNTPVLITSGIRCPRHNAEVGGVSNSQHLYGMAADIVVSGVGPATVAAYVETLMPDRGGIGRYKSFTHVDVRQQKARWNG